MWGYKVCSARGEKGEDSTSPVVNSLTGAPAVGKEKLGRSESLFTREHHADIFPLCCSKLYTGKEQGKGQLVQLEQLPTKHTKCMTHNQAPGQLSSVRLACASSPQ